MPYKDPIQARAANRRSYYKLKGKHPSWAKQNVAWVKDYKRRYTLEKKYGLSFEQYTQLLTAQGGGCAICGHPPKTKPLHVDHNHKTKVNRGLLCFRCNYGLSWFQEDISRLEAAAQYLRG